MFFWNFEVYPVRENEAESGVFSSGMEAAGDHFEYAVTDFFVIVFQNGVDDAALMKTMNTLANIFISSPFRA